jgi:hypothetical protein
LLSGSKQIAKTGVLARIFYVAATFYHALGVYHTKEYHTPTGRPVMIVRHGKLIPELI